MLRTTLLSAAVVALMAAPGIAPAQTASTQSTTQPTTGAGAQPGTGATYRKVEDDNLVVQPFNLTVDQIEDMDVYGTGDEEIGEIEEVLMDASGEPVAVAVEVGGFLGVGDTDAIVMFDRLTLSGDRFTTTMTKEQIETLPEWDD